MYKEFYGFSEKPFNVTPDPDFLYLTKKHEEALANLIYGIESRKGFVVITGEIGTGKTTIIRALLREVDEEVEVALMFNPKLQFIDLLKEILSDLEIPYENSDDKIKLIKKLNDFALEKVSNNKNVIIIIDEAQNLSEDVLEEVRLLTNLETEKDKLIQIFLVGQPELATKIDSSNLIQLKQRISLRFHLTELSKSEIKGYIEHRLSIANPEHNITFNDKAIKKIYAYSFGVPRIINVICDNILITGFTKKTKEFNEKVVDEIAKDFKLDKLKKARSNFLNLLLLLEIITISLFIPILFKTANGVKNISNYFETPKLITQHNTNKNSKNVILKDLDNNKKNKLLGNTIVDTSIVKVLDNCIDKHFKPSKLKVSSFPIIETVFVSNKPEKKLVTYSNNIINVLRSGNLYYYLKPSRLKSKKYKFIINEFKSADKLYCYIPQIKLKKECIKKNKHFSIEWDFSKFKDNKYLMQFEIINKNIKNFENVYFYIDNTSPFLKGSVSPVIVRIGQKIDLFARASYDTLLINAYFKGNKSPLKYDNNIRKCHGSMIIPKVAPGIYKIEFRATDFAENSSKDHVTIEIIK